MFVNILLASENFRMCASPGSSIVLGPKAKPITAYTHRKILAADQAASTLTMIHALASNLTYDNSHSRSVDKGSLRGDTCGCKSAVITT